MQVLRVRWQRLVDARGVTCPRCATTEEEVAKAAEHLNRSLAPVGIAVVVQAERIDQAAFDASPLESNRIWIGGRPLEEWLSASTSSSPCCDACGPNDCRTVSVGGETYEAIPAELIMKAGFVAAAEMLAGRASSTCCPNAPDAVR